jgi:Protein of unknown function (DUF3800)
VILKLKLIYIDESGNTGTRIDDPMQPYHLIAAIAVEDANVRDVENDVRTLGLKHFGEVSRNTDFEFHGYEIHKGKGRYFSKLKVEQRIEIMEDLLGVLKSHNLQIIYTIINKQANKAKLHPHQLAFLFLIERIEDYLVNENSLGLLIADENRDIEQRLINDLERFKTINTGFGYRPTKIDHIVDSLHFVKSHNNHVIQLADIVAYVLLRGKRAQEELTKNYIEQKYQCADQDSFPNIFSWRELHATPKQKVELKHESLLTYRPFIFKEFP